MCVDLGSYDVPLFAAIKLSPKTSHVTLERQVSVTAPSLVLYLDGKVAFEKKRKGGRDLRI